MTPLMRFVLAWVGGLMLTQAFDLDRAWLLLPLPLALALWVGWGDRRWGRQITAILLGLSLGGLRLSAAQPHIAPQHVAYYRGAGEVELVGVVVADPDDRAHDTRLRVKAEQLLLRDDTTYSRDGAFGDSAGLPGLLLSRVPGS